jgi:hypothetical protein
MHTGGIVYEETRHGMDGGSGVFHPDRFEPYYWVEVVDGRLTVRGALIPEDLRFSEDELARVRKACSGADPVDSGPDSAPR